MEQGEAASSYCIDAWEAWIEFQVDVSAGCMVYVMGEVYRNASSMKPTLIKMDLPGGSAHELHLAISSATTDEGEPEEVFYAEPIASIITYDKVFIHYGDLVLWQQDCFDLLSL